MIIFGRFPAGRAAMGFALLGAALLSALANATLRIPNALRHSNFSTQRFFAAANALCSPQH
jgi:hypothetical protein